MEKSNKSQSNANHQNHGPVQSYPEWIRLPRSGDKCPYSNLSRSTLNNLILPCAANGHCPPVKSASIRARYATRGIRMINLPSLLEYIEAQAPPRPPDPELHRPCPQSSHGMWERLRERPVSALARKIREQFNPVEARSSSFGSDRKEDGRHGGNN